MDPQPTCQLSLYTGGTMLNLSKAVLSGASITFAAALLMAQDGAILHPEMKVETGTYDAPAATLGHSSEQPWSATTIAAGVDKKPQPGNEVTLVGELVDFSCYLQLGKHGEKHRSCGQKCAQSGQPVGLLTKDGRLYMLMPRGARSAARWRRGHPDGWRRAYGTHHQSDRHRGGGWRLPRRLRGRFDEVGRAGLKPCAG